MIESVLLITLARFALFFSCRNFLLKKLYNDLQHLAPQSTLPSNNVTPKAGSTYALHSTLAQTCFSLCFTENCILFMILMLQGLDTMDPSSRMINWRISLFILLVTILLFVPVSFSLALTLYSDSSPRSYTRTISLRIGLALVPVGLFICLLSYIPLPAALSSYSPLAAVTCRLVVLGTIILGLLSGLGAVSAAWGVLGRQIRVSSAAITSVEHGLERIRSDLRERTRKVEAYQPPPQSQDGSWLSRVAPFNKDTQLSSMKQELQGLQLLESDMARRLSSLKANQSAAQFAHSFQGRLLTRIWAVYCVGRVCSSIMNIFFPPSSSSSETSPASYGDIIAHFLAYLFSLLSSDNSGDAGKLPVDIPSLSRQISLALVGIIILSSVRVVLRGVTRALRITSRRLSASLMLLTLAQLMGIYLLSTLVQLRTALPPSTISSPPDDNSQLPDDDSNNVFTTLPAYSLFGVLFDWSFLLSASACALAKWLGGVLNNDDFY